MAHQISTVNYANGVVPPQYTCDNCSAHGVKLWREYQTFADHTSLLCANCAEVVEQKTHDAGWQSPFKSGRGDQIGWYIPAVPVEGKDLYWGYTLVPDEGCRWWHTLPASLPVTT